MDDATKGINWETNDRHRVVETQISIPLGGDKFVFSLWLPRYIHDALTREDWDRSGLQLIQQTDRIIREACLSGDYFLPDGGVIVRERIMAAMKALTHRRFLERQNREGNLEWAAPSLLLGERYKN